MSRRTPDCTEAALVPASARPGPDFSGHIRRRGSAWLGSRGIYRHQLQDVEQAWRRAQAEDASVSDPVSTVFGRQWNGSGDCPATVFGRLARWTHPDGAVSYSAQINRSASEDNMTTDSYGTLTITTLDDLCELAKVGADLRYEWASIAIWKDRG
jgi:hypothetical protein